MFEEFTPHIPVVRLFDCSEFCDSVGCIKAAASIDIKEITFLGDFLIWNNSAVYGGRVRLKISCVSGLTCGNPVRGSPR